MSKKIETINSIRIKLGFPLLKEETNMLLEQIRNDMKQAMRDKDKFKLSTLRMLLSMIDTERGKVSADKVFTEDEVIGFINRNIKQLQKEREAYGKAGVLSDSQDKEIAILQQYLPTQLTEDEVIGIILTVTEEAENMGEAMKKLAFLKGKADMAFVSKMVKLTYAK
jgi:uncharacterized protein YqeY